VAAWRYASPALSLASAAPKWRQWQPLASNEIKQNVMAKKMAKWRMAKQLSAA
jgi:hypothetical protein